MRIPTLYSKIHRATVTGALLEYEGSIGIDADLLQAAGIQPFQRVEIYNITNGNRLATYAIAEEPGSGKIQTNGAAAHLARQGDLIIIAAYCEMEPEELPNWQPKIVLLDEHNKPKTKVLI